MFEDVLLSQCCAVFLGEDENTMAGASKCLLEGRHPPDLWV